MGSSEPDSRSAGSVRRAHTDTAALDGVPLENLSEALFERLQKIEDSQSLGKLLGQLRTRLTLLTNSASNRYSIVKSKQLLQSIRRHPHFSDQLVAGRTLVEFGCGALNPLAGHMAFAALGANRCIGLDLEPPDHPDLAARAMYDVAAEMLVAPHLYYSHPAPDPEFLRKNLGGIDLQGLRDGHFDALPAERFQVLQLPADRTGLEADSAHMCASISFLEHVTNVDEVIAEMARITPTDFLGMHLIDGADHRSYWKPEYDVLQFLTESADVENFTGCNRIRPRQFIKTFEDHGFEVCEFKPLRTKEITAEFRAQLVAPFEQLTDEELQTVDACIYVRKR
jgi:hypothetical protein